MSCYTLVHAVPLTGADVLIRLPRPGGRTSTRRSNTVLRSNAERLMALGRVSGGGLLLEGFTQLAEQPRICSMAITAWSAKVATKTISSVKGFTSFRTSAKTPIRDSLTLQWHARGWFRYPKTFWYPVNWYSGSASTSGIWNRAPLQRDTPPQVAKSSMQRMFE